LKKDTSVEPVSCPYGGFINTKKPFYESKNGFFESELAGTKLELFFGRLEAIESVER